MAKKKQQSIGDLIEDIQADLSVSIKRDIPDIITFVEDQEWLGMPFHPSNPLNLFSMQNSKPW